MFWLYAFAFLAPAIAKGNNCDDGWVENLAEGQCYNFVNETMSWDEANDNCTRQDAELVSIFSSQEDSFVYENVKVFLGTNILAIWMGAIIKPDESSFKWTNGLPMNYTHWRRPIPIERKEDFFVGMGIINYKGFWGISPNSTTRILKIPFVCQKPVRKCGDNWSIDTETGSCYQILNDELSWQEAREECMSLDKRSDLVSIRFEDENSFVQNMLRKNDTSPGVKGFWTGGNDIKDEGSWVWTDGSPVKYTDWHNGQGKPTKNKDCIAMWKSFDYEWKDWQCKMTLPSVCKIENKK